MVPWVLPPAGYYYSVSKTRKTAFSSAKISLPPAYLQTTDQMPWSSVEKQQEDKISNQSVVYFPLHLCQTDRSGAYVAS
jgi:hypothetical protein